MGGIGVSLAQPHHHRLLHLGQAQARAGQWRISERTLHGLALAGGWPGALLAQRWLRHKTIKRSFRIQFWATVALNLAAFVALSPVAQAWWRP